MARLFTLIEHGRPSVHVNSLPRQLNTPWTGAQQTDGALWMHYGVHCLANELKIAIFGHAAGGSVFFWQHDRDGRPRVVDVERAASGDQLNKLRSAVVVADIESHRQTVETGPAAKHGKPPH